MNKQEASLPSDWMSIARKDWNRIFNMLGTNFYEII